MDPAGVVIIGAGLAGLSCAFHLGGGTVLEREREPGGLCRTRRVAGFLFDYTGHLLHLRDPYVRGLVERLAPGVFVAHDRRARIWSKGRLTAYPFQANLHGLPEAVVEECLEGLRTAEAARSGEPVPDDFRSWTLATFGEGIARHFMLPYNAKLWRVPLEELTADWVARMVPVPKLEEAQRGAREPDGVTMGYNARFLYPAAGGIEALPRALAPHVPGLLTRREVVEVDVAARRVDCADGSSFHYETLVSTMPLPELVRRIPSAPRPVALAAAGLRHVSVRDVNLGVRRERVSPAHWIYFPEKEYPFYRAGFPSNFSSDAAPRGCSSLYLEVARLPGENPTGGDVAESCLAGLLACGILRPDDEVAVWDQVDIPYAYVIHDRHRRAALPLIVSWLEARGIMVAGRYGAWEYSAMEDAILAGKRIAEVLRGGRG